MDHRLCYDRRLWVHPEVLLHLRLRQEFKDHRKDLVLYPHLRLEVGTQPAERVSNRTGLVYETRCRFRDDQNDLPRLGMRKEPLCPEVPMKPLYWTRILVPVVPTERGSVDASESAVQVLGYNTSRRGRRVVKSWLLIVFSR